MQYIIPLRRPVIRLVTLHTVQYLVQTNHDHYNFLNVIGGLAALFFTNHSVQL